MAFLRTSPPTLEEEGLQSFDSGVDPAEYEERLGRISLARGLKKYRGGVQISQVIMAKMMGVSKRSYIDYEHNGRAVPSSALVELLAHTNLDMNELFFGEEKPIQDHRLEETAMQAFRLMERLRGNYPDISEALLQKGAATYCRYFSPAKPINPDALTDIMNSIFYEKFKTDELNDSTKFTP